MRALSLVGMLALAACGGTATDAGPDVGVDASTDSGVDGDVDAVVDGSVSGDAGVIDDEATPCLDFATQANGVALAIGDGRALAWSELGATTLSLSDGSLMRTYAGHRGRIVDAAISPDGSRGASVGTDDALRMWDANTGRTLVVASLSMPEHVALASDGAIVIALDALGLHGFAWGHSREMWFVPRVASASPRVLAASASGALVLVSGETETLDLFSASAGELVGHVQGEHGALSADGARAATGLGTTVSIVDTTDLTAVPATLTTPSRVKGIALSPDGALIATADSAIDAVVHVLRVEGGALLHTFQTDAFLARELAFTADARQLAVANHRLYVFDVDTGATVYAPHARGFFYTQSFSPVAPHVALSGVGGDVEVWDLQSRRRIQVMERPFAANYGSVLFEPSGDLLVNVDDEGAYWPPGASVAARSFTFESGGAQFSPVVDLAFSPDGAVLVGPGDVLNPGALRWWDAHDGRLLREIDAHPGTIEAVAWSANGALIASVAAETAEPDPGSDTPHVIKLWTAEGVLVRALTGHERTMSSLSFSPDSSLLVSGDYAGRVRLWSTVDGSMVRELSAPLPPSSSGELQDRFDGKVAFSPDGALVASFATHWIASGHSAYAAIYRVVDGTIVRELRGYGDANIGHPGWSRDGRFLFAGTGFGYRVWCMTPDALAPIPAD